MQSYPIVTKTPTINGYFILIYFDTKLILTYVARGQNCYFVACLVDGRKSLQRRFQQLLVSPDAGQICFSWEYFGFMTSFKNQFTKNCMFKPQQLYSLADLLLIFYLRPTKKQMKISSVYIVAAKRTPIGSFLGKLSNFSAPQLGGFAIKGALESINLNPKQVDEVILGNVLSAGLGQAPARQASISAGLGVETPCTTLNKVCSSGLKSLVFGSQSIALGHSNTVVTGGFECMSKAPFLLFNTRKGTGFGHQQLYDAISYDGLQDAFNKMPMGNCAEKTADDFKITREAQDDYCKLSYKRHIEAIKAGLLKDEIVSIKIKDKKAEEEFNEDEEWKRYREDKISSLAPAFSKTGTITAANASKINDGACSLVLMSEQKVRQTGVKPLARIVNYADAEIEPVDFAIAPQYSTKKVLLKAGLKINDIDYFEYNEAFSVVALANMKLLDIGEDRVNLHGGAVAMGHPIGMSGARIVQSLLTVMKNRGGKYGLAAICNGGGGSTAMIIENLQTK